MKVIIEIPDNEVPTRQEYVEIGLHFIDGHICECTYPYQELEAGTRDTKQ